ncbi:MAG: hypothetical protein U1E06_17190 [Tabrizicola sp.]|nr:hypothetical protein [Tabrizicola sp.]
MINAVRLALTLKASSNRVVRRISGFGLMQLQSTRRTLPVFQLLSLATLSLAVWQLLQPRLPYGCVGTAEGTIGIAASTPAKILNAIRYGVYPGAPEAQAKVKTVVKAQDALAKMAAGKLSGAVVPIPLAPPDAILWQTKVLSDATGNHATTALVLGPRWRFWSGADSSTSAIPSQSPLSS